MKREHVVKVGLWSVFGLITACLMTAPAFAVKPINILINSSPWYSGFEAVVEEYQAITGNEVNIDRTPYNGVLEKARNAVRGNVSDYDLVNLDNGWIVEFYSGGFLTPLTDIDPDFKLGDDIITAGDAIYWNAKKNWPTRNGGKLLAFSPCANTHLWYYRADKIDTAPKTWDDVFANCAALHKPPKTFGAVQRGERGNPVRFAFMPHMLGFGGSILKDPENGDFTVTFNSPEVKAALDNFLRLHKECNTANPGAVGQGEMIQYVLTGKAQQAGIVVAAQAQMDNPKKSAVVGKINYTIFPRPKNGKHHPVFGSWQMGVPKNISDERKAAAMEFIKYFLTEKAQTVYAEKGGIPIHSGVLTGPLSEKPKFRWMKAYAESAAAATPVLLYKEGAQVEEIIGLRLNQAIIGELTATEALNKSATEIAELMTRNGRSSGNIQPLR